MYLLAFLNDTARSQPRSERAKHPTQKATTMHRRQHPPRLPQRHPREWQRRHRRDRRRRHHRDWRGSNRWGRDWRGSNRWGRGLHCEVIRQRTSGVACFGLDVFAAARGSMSIDRPGGIDGVDRSIRVAQPIFHCVTFLEHCHEIGTHSAEIINWHLTSLAAPNLRAWHARPSRGGVRVSRNDRKL